MLKKAGIVVAASAATLLAVSPLAFAGDKDGGHDHGHHSSTSVTKKVTNTLQSNGVSETGGSAQGLIAIGEVNALNDNNVCPTIPVELGVGNILGLLSPAVGNNGAGPVAGVVCGNPDITTQGNANAG